MKGLRQIVKEEQCEPPVGLAALIGEPFSLKQLHGDSFCAFGPVGLVVVATGAAAGWLFGWVNERRGDGSIIPSWLAHGTGNALAYTLALLL